MTSTLSTLTICSFFVLSSVFFLVSYLLYLVCKHSYRLDRNDHLYSGTKTRDSCDVAVLIPPPIPQFIYQCDQEPPDYFEAARASPLPSYDDVLYCDQVARSFQNLISAK